jgi:peptidase M50-like protein
MHTLRKYLGWVFAFTSLVCLQIVISSILHTTHRQSTDLALRGLLVETAFLTALAVVFGVAWWTVWKGKPSARGWGIAASLTNILVSLPWVFISRDAWRDLWVILAIGVAGLVVFWRRYEQPNFTARPQEHQPIPGDGTTDLVNKMAGVLIFVVSYGVYSWWLRWLRAKHFPAGYSFWDRSLMFVLIVFVIATLHELGHTATGLALGMKLRAFLVGPFQWRIRDGKWSFQFNPAAILSGGGATGVVPPSAAFPRWRTLCMVAAGPLVTLLTGSFALWIALAAKGNAAAQASVPLSLLGAWSLVLCAVNLVPLRIQGNYTDVAQIYQLLSDGPWGDFHRVAAVAGSSLVTPLRPRNFDIQAILRAAHSITQRMQGLILRLYSYTYFLDTGRISEAGEALREAESIHHQSASDMPTELHTEFVFGSAYVRRDAAAAREWWTRMEAKKPTRFKEDYWRAAGALHWIEGDLKAANEAWEKANALAQQLPKAGAYEFDRYCCSLLHQALDEVPVAR